MNTGDKMRRLREDRLMTQADLAAKLGVSQTAVSVLESGRHRPRFDTLKRVAKALRVSPHALVGDDARTSEGARR